MKNVQLHLKCQLAIIIAFSLSFLSCKKNWLDVKTDQSIAVPATLTDFQALLDNSNAGTNKDMNINSSNLGEIGSDDHYILDVTYNTRTEQEKNAYTWTNQFGYSSNNSWNASYGRIAVCNIILEGINKIKPIAVTEQQNWNNVKGQALFQRSRNFYELAQTFAPQYVIQTANTDLGIPLRLESDINIQSSRSTVQETYQQLINDLLIAKDLLPNTPLYKTRASKPAVFALLARVYLSIEDYGRAGKYADSCLNIYNTLLDYNLPPIDPSASFPIPRLNNEVIFHSNLINNTTITSQARVDQSFRDLYSNDDMRKTVFFGSSSGLITFKGHYYGGGVCFNGLAVDEQYLIRAECYAREGKITQAMSDLNTLLKKRWRNTVSYPTIAAIDAENALKQILLERRKELLFRGLRWSDLRRLNRDPRFAVTVTRIVNGMTYALEPNSYKYTFPIPNDIIQFSKIPQNSGW